MDRTQMCEYIRRRESMLDTKTGKQILTIVMAETSKEDLPKIVKKSRGRENIALNELSDALLERIYTIVESRARDLQSPSQCD